MPSRRAKKKEVVSCYCVCVCAYHPTVPFCCSDDDASLKDAVYYGHAPHAFSPRDSTPPDRQYSDGSFRGELFRHQVKSVGRHPAEVGVEEGIDEEDRDIIDSPEIDTTNDWTPFYS